jgi:hypothetical protein
MHVVFGERLTLEDMAILAGVSRSTIIQRLTRGMSAEQAAVTPHAYKASAHQDVGRIKLVAKKHGISYTTLHARLRRGLSMPDALAAPIKSETRGVDLVGRWFGTLRVECPGPSGGQSKAWICICSHGERCLRTAKQLHAKAPTCDCPGAARPVKADLVGQRFGRLVVKRCLPRKLVCDCDCGAPDVVRKRSGVVGGSIRSCGCLRRETAAVRGRANAGHRKEGT